MYAVEFDTRIENGTINVPKQYMNLQQVDAKVIVMVDDSACLHNPCLNEEEKVAEEKHIESYMDSLAADYESHSNDSLLENLNSLIEESEDKDKLMKILDSL
jgi:hypothetical protein